MALLYFGKLPSRGDFVRSNGHPALIQSLDRWQAQAMEKLSLDPRWKLVYDQASPLSFAILGMKSKVGLAGHWLASRDASGRRFPFVTAAAFDVAQPPAFIQHSPMALARLWARLEQIARVAHAAVDLSHAQGSLHGSFEGELDVEPCKRALNAFLETQRLAGVEQMLAAAGWHVSLRHLLLAIGLLLQPVLAQGPGRLHKALRLPLPQDPSLRAPLASAWLSLVTPFFARSSAELALFFTSQEGRPELVLGFQGACASTLCALVDPETLNTEAVTLTDADWVEQCVQEDWGLRKLSNYLRDPGLSLGQAQTLYHEVFLGS